MAIQGVRISTAHMDICQLSALKSIARQVPPPADPLARQLQAERPETWFFVLAPAGGFKHGCGSKTCTKMAPW